MNINMPDPYLELFHLLQDKEQQNSLANINSVKETIRVVANRLRDMDGENPLDARLDAAFAYYVAGYYVRASRLISQADINHDTHPAQQWLALFMTKQFQNIENQVRAIVQDEKYSDEKLAVEIRHHGLSDSEALGRMLIRKLADAMNKFMAFVQSGDESRLEEARSALLSCQKAACKVMDWRWWWWLECIRLVIAEFAVNCLWTQLQLMQQEDGANEIVSRYVIANYQQNNPVVELWRTQVGSLDKINDPDRCSFCLSIPTSGGKTRIAELAILRFFLDYQDDPSAKCVYIAPLRKLAHEVEESLSPVLSAATLNPGVVSSFYGGQEVDPLDWDQVAEARVLIVTPEKLDGMMRQNANLRSQIRLVIADEGHMIGEDNDRGYRYRMLLERLIYTLRIKPVDPESVRPRLLFVSGVLPDISEFAKLITGDCSNVVHIDWRPLDEPLMMYWEWNGTQLTASTGPHPILFNAPECNNSNQFEQVVVSAAFAHALSSHTLVFSASKRAIESETLLELLDCLLDQQPFSVTTRLPSELPRLDAFKAVSEK
jgi:hypothetical protein